MSPQGEGERQAGSPGTGSDNRFGARDVSRRIAPRRSCSRGVYFRVWVAAGSPQCLHASLLPVTRPATLDPNTYWRVTLSSRMLPGPRRASAWAWVRTPSLRYPFTSLRKLDLADIAPVAVAFQVQIAE